MIYRWKKNMAPTQNSENLFKRIFWKTYFFKKMKYVSLQSQ